MLPRKRLAMFFVRLLVVYGLLIAPWPGLQRAYDTAYVTISNVVFGTFGAHGTVRFWLAEPASGDDHVRVTLSKRLEPTKLTTLHDARLTAYLPTALVVALVLATPAAGRRRRRHLVVGLVLVHGFVGLRLLIMLLHEYSGDGPWCLFEPGPSGERALASAFEIVVAAPTLTFVVPVFIWIVACGPDLRRASLFVDGQAVGVLDDGAA